MAIRRKLLLNADVAVDDQNGALIVDPACGPIGTALHVTNATSGAAVDMTNALPIGTRYVEGFCESDFYYKRGAGAANTDIYHPAGRFVIEWRCEAVSTLSFLVTSGAATRIDAQPMGVAA